MKIFVDPACDIKYASFYIEGMRRVAGRSNVRFCTKRFRDFAHNNFFMPIVIEAGGQTFRVIIDFADWASIKQNAYDWCDLYCKINITFDDLANRHKLFSIGPGFGIRIFSMPETIGHALVNFLKARGRIGNKKRFLSDYVGQYKRLPLSRYTLRGQSEKGYVFFASTIWKSEPQTNTFRANFIKACRSVRGILFEGGFAPRYLNDVPGFEDMTISTRVPTDEYLEKCSRSMVVFNTPAVVQCHGWKLAEYLAMGKAIISTPLSRELPAPLNDGTHLLITSGTPEDIAKKVTAVLENGALMKSLETGASAYFDRYLQPQAVIRSILGRLLTDQSGDR